MCYFINVTIFFSNLLFKVVVFFVISVLLTLVVYMGYLMCFDPMLRKRRLQMPYRQQRDEVNFKKYIFLISRKRSKETQNSMTF